MEVINMLRVATDIGGTFTDLVFVTPEGEVVTGKSHTTPAQFEKGVMDVIAASGTTPSEFASFVHGTTIVINAITERKGAKVGLLTSEGFRDILEIGRGTRPDFFNLEYRKPEPFVPRYLRREVKGRINYKGIETTPLDLSGLPAILDDFRAEGVEAIAICFINSYANPAHEEAALARVKELWPEVSAVASHQITREWREYERTSTAVLSAYVQPVAHRYLDRLTSALYEAGMRCTPYIMQSNCGVDTVKSARQIPITMVESGPASGIWGAAALGRLIGELDAIAIDVGGTTAKCGLSRAARSSSTLTTRSDAARPRPAIRPWCRWLTWWKLAKAAAPLPGWTNSRGCTSAQRVPAPCPARCPTASAAQKRRPPTPTWRWVASTRTISAVARWKRTWTGCIVRWTSWPCPYIPLPLGEGQGVRAGRR